MINELLTPILNRQTPDVNFFEGRLLTGRDLRDQQDADQHRFQHIGQAIGAGIINGLEVELVEKGSSEKKTILKVKAGTALNAEGKLLELELDKDITLIPKQPPAPANGHFTTCQPPIGVELTNFGIYILVMSPASGLGVEQVAKIGLEDQGVARDCGHRYALKGVQFRIEALRPANLKNISDQTRELFEELLKASDLASLSKLQNLVAHLCFGTEVLEGLSIDPFSMVNSDSAYKKYGAVDDLNDLKRMTDCDMPLAVMHWARQGIGFIDMWSVRRRPYMQSFTNTCSIPTQERQQAEAEARFLQFQDQITKIVDTTEDPRTIEATLYFCYLPPMGVLPLGVSNSDFRIDIIRFFLNRTIRSPVYINWEKIESLMFDSWQFSAIDLDKTQTKNQTKMTWLYLIRENLERISTVTSGRTGERLVLFCAGDMPFYGESRFDVSHWDYSNYTSHII